MRKTTKIMKNWLFTDLDGSQVTLDLPHTWNALDGQDGGDDYRRGTCTYETEKNNVLGTSFPISSC